MAKSIKPVILKIVIGQCDEVDDKDFRVAVITTKRIANAVKRNKIKRWIKEFMRQTEIPVPPGLCFLFITKSGIFEYGRKNIIKDITYVIEKIKQNF